MMRALGLHVSWELQVLVVLAVLAVAFIWHRRRTCAYEEDAGPWVSS